MGKRRPPTADRRPPTADCHVHPVIRSVRSPWSSVGRLWSLTLLLLALTGCMLTSGERTEQELRPEAGSLVTTFVGGDGEELRTLAAGQPGQRYAVTVFVSADQGELRLELLDPQGALAFVAQSRPGERLARSGVVQADAQGILRYRVSARGARKGSYELFYQQS